MVGTLGVDWLEIQSCSCNSINMGLFSALTFIVGLEPCFMVHAELIRMYELTSMTSLYTVKFKSASYDPQLH